MNLPNSHVSPLTSQTHADSSTSSQRVVHVKTLFEKGQTRLHLQHEDQVYILQITQNNKLILTK